MILLDIVVETGQDIEDEQARAYYYMACVEYGAYGREPDQESMPDSIRVAWRLTKDALDHSRAKAEAGRIGGKQSGSKRKANAKQTRSKDEANRRERSGQRPCPGPHGGKGVLQESDGRACLYGRSGQDVAL